jgi:formylglycine-generating enzyme required for sulfatase activity
VSEDAIARPSTALLRAKALALVALLLAGSLAGAAQPDSDLNVKAALDLARVPGGDFRSVLPNRGPNDAGVRVMAFALQRTPVTNREFLAFVRSHSQWQRGRVTPEQADNHYLQSWAGPLELGQGVSADQPVTGVSWFAARAFCESYQARLPSWNEWEFAAAANERVGDARHDPAWRQTALQWFSRAPDTPLPAVGRTAPNIYGIHDLHGLVWEWVGDFEGLFASPNSPGVDHDAATDHDNAHAAHPADHESMAMSPAAMAMSCGGAALAVADPEDYPTILRLAMLASLQRNSTTANLGFRCAR